MCSILRARRQLCPAKTIKLYFRYWQKLCSISSSVVYKWRIKSNNRPLYSLHHWEKPIPQSVLHIKYAIFENEKISGIFISFQCTKKDRLAQSSIHYFKSQSTDWLQYMDFTHRNINSKPLYSSYIVPIQIQFVFLVETLA